jgi:hypothetical protein
MTDEGPSENLLDPDGHHLVVVGAGRNAAWSHADKPANADTLSVPF